ncbi:MAG: hypothetical protein LC664_05855 [Flavobacteriales bacterium]|nr:hypothetical protein [Flavobacteriales bacterium]
MKSILLTLGVLFFTVALVAQPVSKKGELYLPEEGDWSIGVDAAPFLGYIGNFFSDSDNESPSAQFPNNNFAISGKYFVKEDIAYRGRIRLNIFSDKDRSFSPEFSTSPTNTTVEDAYNRNFNNVNLAFGIEKRRGKTRIQGFYGAEATLGLGTEKHTFDYGNGIVPENTNPDRSEFTLEFQDDPEEVSNITDNGAFITEFTRGTTFSIGARAFVGAEIFLFPKMSLGLELGLGAAFFYEGNGTVVTEQWSIPVGGNSEQYVTTVTDQGGSSTFDLDSDNTNGALFLNFYF